MTPSDDVSPIKVLALAKYGDRAASTRQRLLQYAPFLAERGVSVDLHPLLDNGYLAALMDGRGNSKVLIARDYARRLLQIATIRDYDVIWVQYELFPYLPVIDRLLTIVCDRPIVYDIDDAIFHMYDAHRIRPIRWLLKGKLNPLIRRAAVCLCGNAYLLDYVRSAGGTGIVVPTVVDTDLVRPLVERPDRPLTIGWIGSPSTWRYVEPLLATLLPAMARLNARFRVVGAGPAARGIAGIDAVDWNESTEVAELQSMDIGLMPLPDEPWARGKCGYKLIQYMACGLPTIASPVGVNSALVEHGYDGYLARTQTDWVGLLETLAGDADLRRQMGDRGRRKVVASYSLRSQQLTVLTALRAAAARAPIGTASP